MFHPMSQSDKHPDNFSTEEENISLKEDQCQIQMKQLMKASYYQQEVW